MTVSEQRRRALHARLAEVLGEEAANELMEQLPPVPWHDLATHADVDRATVLLRSELAAMAAQLRGEMAKLGSDLRGDMTELRAEVKGDIAGLRGDLRTEIASVRLDMAKQTRSLVFSMIGMWLATMSVLGGLFVSTAH